MIEFILAENCLGCGNCVAACPTDVLAADEAGMPVIARQDDCQSCFLCELHCESDAIYVGARTAPEPKLDRAAVLASGTMGAFRRLSGWGSWSGDPRYPNEHWRMDEIFRRARGPVSRDAGGNPLREASLPPTEPALSVVPLAMRGQP